MTAKAARCWTVRRSRFALLVLVFAACSSSGNSTPTTGSRPTHETTTLPAFNVVLDDSGLTVPNGELRAGPYRVSFVDRRTTQPPSEIVSLRFGVAGGPPYVEMGQVAPGQAISKTLYGNETVYLAINDALRDDVRRHGSFSITTTADYPTPVT
jgi:hypothetical protein